MGGVLFPLLSLSPSKLWLAPWRTGEVLCFSTKGVSLPLQAIKNGTVGMRLPYLQVSSKGEHRFLLLNVQPIISVLENNIHQQ